MTQYQSSLNLKRISPIILIAAAVVFLLIFWNRMTINIPEGHGGVLFEQFGGGVVTDHTYGEGFHFLAPWNRMILYNARIQQKEETMTSLSSNGLEIKVDVSVWFKPEFKNLGNIHAKIGPDYIQSIVIPGIRDAARSVVGRYTPEEIYSKKRESIKDEIYSELSVLLAAKFVILDKVLIRSVILPATIKTAIESKLNQEQLALEYEFKLERAQKEAERMSIEAEGKAAAFRIISASLTDKILREKGIEATLELAKSANSKVVVIGGSGDGLPLILGDTK